MRPACGGFDRAAQRSLVAGMHDDRRAAGTSFARATSRSYLVGGGAANGPIAAMAPISLSLSAGMITSPVLRLCRLCQVRIRTLLPGVPFEPGERGWDP